MTTTTRTDDDITVRLDSPNGPTVTVRGDLDADMILAALPSGYTIADDDWGNGVRLASGAHSFPLSTIDGEDDEIRWAVASGPEEDYLRVTILDEEDADGWDDDEALQARVSLCYQTVVEQRKQGGESALSHCAVVGPTGEILAKF